MAYWYILTESWKSWMPRAVSQCSPEAVEFVLEVYHRWVLRARPKFYLHLRNCRPWRSIPNFSSAENFLQHQQYLERTGPISNEGQSQILLQNPNSKNFDWKILIEGYFEVSIRLKIIWEQVPTEPYWEAIDKLVQDIVVRELEACTGISVFHTRLQNLQGLYHRERCDSIHLQEERQRLLPTDTIQVI